MTPLQLDVWSALLILGIGQGCTLLAVIITKQRDKQSHYFLGGLLVILTASLLEFLLLSSNYYSLFPHLLYATQPLLFLLGPLFYFYVRARLGHPFPLSLKSAVHLIPFILALLNHVPWYVIGTAEKIAMIEQSIQADPRGIGLRSFLLALSHMSLMLVYLFWSLRLVGAYRKQQAPMTRQQFQQLLFLKLFSRSFLIYWALQVIGLVFITFFQLYIYQIDYVLALLNSFFIQALGAYFLMKPNMVLDETVDKYEQSSLTEAQSEKLLGEISLLMQGELFLNPDLTLEDLSEELDTNKNYISQVINQEFGVNFSEYINAFRIDKAKHLLQDNRTNHLKLLGIALESGFNNKTSFTRVFRKHTGLTPSEFRSTLHIEV